MIMMPNRHTWIEIGYLIGNHRGRYDKLVSDPMEYLARFVENIKRVYSHELLLEQELQSICGIFEAYNMDIFEGVGMDNGLVWKYFQEFYNHDSPKYLKYKRQQKISSNRMRAQRGLPPL